MRKEHGFTLVELLIVLAILAILVGIVAVSLNGLTATAQERAKQSEKEIVQSALDVYFTQVCGVEGKTDGDCAEVAAGSEKIIETSETETDLGFYLRRDTKYAYSWDTSGNIIAQADEPAAGE